jgi:tetratricopeptide (TPR) repeat protein
MADAVAHYERALAVDPDLAPALVDLAWIRATSDRPDVRAPLEAVRLARHVDELTQHRSATVADTLGAAYAAAGNYPEAVAAVERAIELAAADKAPSAVIARFRQHLDSYRRIR